MTLPPNVRTTARVASAHEMAQRLSLVAAAMGILSGEGTEVRGAQHGKKVVHRWDSMAGFSDAGGKPFGQGGWGLLRAT